MCISRPVFFDGGYLAVRIVGVDLFLYIPLARFVLDVYLCLPLAYLYQKCSVAFAAVFVYDGVKLPDDLVDFVLSAVAEINVQRLGFPGQLVVGYDCYICFSGTDNFTHFITRIALFVPIIYHNKYNKCHFVQIQVVESNKSVRIENRPQNRQSKTADESTVIRNRRNNPGLAFDFNEKNDKIYIEL